MCQELTHKWIGVFKTNVELPQEVHRLQPVLDGSERIMRWNFDLSDCDRILRIESHANIAPEIIRLMRCQGYVCEELE